ncbi:DUF3087 family protein [Pseudoalteromonas tunicata]|uniref:DUF3087 family protein n=1 Tax=Pseudoalteromonas tunicata TaxID=314281 RepID=UPI00273FE4C3|nr:DUF3087 family protein [Pseudoalteromonas tunicata]MDP5213999.1 DUF3087 family protein [Pseudoalteromonas tunicata]
MQLQKINKQRYRKHLNIIIVAAIVVLSILSLSISQSLIALFPSEQGSHFHWNLIGVICGSLIIGFVLKHNREHTFMTEVMYVWDLKQALNQVTRKLQKVKNAVDQGDVSAMHTLHFYYSGNRQLWLLDDNTITLDDLAIWQAELEVKAKSVNLILNASLHDPLYLRTL